MQRGKATAAQGVGFRFKPGQMASEVHVLNLLCCAGTGQAQETTESSRKRSDWNQRIWVPPVPSHQLVGTFSKWLHLPGP